MSSVSITFDAASLTIDPYGSNSVSIYLTANNLLPSEIETINVKVIGKVAYVGNDVIDNPFYTIEVDVGTIATGGDDTIAFTWDGNEKFDRNLWYVSQFDNHAIYYKIYAYDAQGDLRGESVDTINSYYWLKTSGFKTYSTNGIEAIPWVDHNDSTDDVVLTKDESVYIRYFSRISTGIYHKYWDVYNDGTGDLQYKNLLRTRLLGGAINNNGYVISNNIIEWGFWGSEDDPETSNDETDYAYCSVTIPEEKFVNYFPISCNVLAGEVSTDGVAAIKVYGVFFNDKFGPNGITNAIQSLKLTYYKSGESTPQAITNYDVALIETPTANNYEVTLYISGLNPTYRYTFSATVADYATSATSSDTHQATIYGTPTFDWGKDDFKFNVPVNIDNGGLTIREGYLDLTGKIILNSSYNQSIPTYGVWTPTFDFDYEDMDAGASDLWDFNGYYTRFGDMCLINFYFKCRPLHVSSLAVAFKIHGLPFEPDPNIPVQAGGGMMSGYLTFDGNNDLAFSGWTIEKGPDWESNTEFSIFGRVSDTTASSGVPKYTDYVSAVFTEYSEEIEGSGTIFYKIAEGQ